MILEQLAGRVEILKFDDSQDHLIFNRHHDLQYTGDRPVINKLKRALKDASEGKSKKEI